MYRFHLIRRKRSERLYQILDITIKPFQDHIYNNTVMYIKIFNAKLKIKVKQIFFLFDFILLIRFNIYISSFYFYNSDSFSILSLLIHFPVFFMLLLGQSCTAGFLWNISFSIQINGDSIVKTIANPKRQDTPRSPMCLHIWKKTIKLALLEVVLHRNYES